MRTFYSYTRLVILLMMTLATTTAEAKKKAAHMVVATYNIRYANHQDSLQRDGWGQRYPVMARLILSNGFEIFGTQEGLKRQLDELKAALPGYDYIGIGRDDGLEAGEHSAIFYRTDLFRLIDHGDFWLSEHPDRPGLGWDAVCPRICSWGHFRHKASGKEFLFFNLHMDHVGKTARIEAAKLVMQKTQELGKRLPAILTGDFNVDQTSPAYDTLARSGVFQDSYEMADFCYAENGTFNAWSTTSFSTARIDHIFLTQQFKVERYAVLTDTYRVPIPDDAQDISGDKPAEVKLTKYESHNPSDHFPVRIIVDLK